jgi:Wnt-binding factor required for Wnt secretion
MPGPVFPIAGAKYNKEDEATEQIYAINAPKIFLETLSARSTTIIFAVTYIAFIVGFAIDINAAYKGFTSADVVLPGINSSPNTWNGTVKSLANVISISLTVRQSNFTQLDLVNQTASRTYFNATIWACYMDQGCGQNFDESGGFDGMDVWHQVLSSKENLIYAPLKEENVLTTWELIPTTFQNQESIPARGKVRSYYFHIEYTQTSSELFASTSFNSNEAPTAFYTVNVLTRPGSSVTSGTFSVILLLVVCFTLVGFIYVMVQQQKKWLTEQKWVCYYLAALIIFINPIYCAIIWQQDVAPTLVFAFYFFDAMGQAAFFVVWLLFADSINRKAMSHFRFYVPKILIGFSIFVTSVVVLVYQFPSVSPPNSTNSKRNPSQAVIDWSPELQYSFTAVSITVLLLMSIWVFYWLITLFLTGRQLNTLPYMNTRYLQLSYRFFLLQAYLLAAYFVFQYCFIIYLLLRETASGGVQNIVELTDYLNALSRQQTQLFGKVVFLAVYALVLAFLFLPASLGGSDLATTLASTYVLTEKEMKRVVKTRRLAISNVRNVLAGVVQKIVDAKAEVFCVETAITFCNMSFEAYYDSLNLKTVAGYDTKEMDLKKYGYELIDTIYRPDHETFCIIARHVSLNKLVVCFRGTSCKQHWSDNLNYTQRELLLPALTDLDATDGLGENIEINIERERNTTTTSEIEMGLITPLSGSVDVEQPHTDDNIIQITPNPLSFHETPVELSRVGSFKNSAHRHVQPTLRDNWRRASVLHHTEGKSLLDQTYLITHFSTESLI